MNQANVNKSSLMENEDATSSELITLPSNNTDLSTFTSQNNTVISTDPNQTSDTSNILEHNNTKSFNPSESADTSQNNTVDSPDPNQSTDIINDDSSQHNSTIKPPDSSESSDTSNIGDSLIQTQEEGDTPTLRHNSTDPDPMSTQQQQTVSDKDNEESDMHLSSDEKSELSIEESVAQQLYKDSAITAKKSSIPTPLKQQEQDTERSNIDRLVSQTTRYILQDIKPDKFDHADFNNLKTHDDVQNKMTTENFAAKLKTALKDFAMQLEQEKSQDRITDLVSSKSRNDGTPSINQESIYFFKPSSLTDDKSSLSKKCDGKDCKRNKSQVSTFDNNDKVDDSGSSVPNGEHQQRSGISQQQQQPQSIYQQPRQARFYTNQPYSPSSYFQPIINNNLLGQTQQFPSSATASTIWRSLLRPLVQSQQPGDSINRLEQQLLQPSQTGESRRFKQELLQTLPQQEPHGFEQKLSTTNDIFINRVNNYLQNRETCAQPSPCRCEQYPCTCLQRICKCSDLCCQTSPCLCACSNTADSQRTLMSVISEGPDQACVCPYGISSKCYCRTQPNPNLLGFPSPSSKLNMFGFSNMELAANQLSLPPIFQKAAPSPCVFPFCGMISQEDATSRISCGDCHIVCRKSNAFTDPCFASCRCMKHHHHRHHHHLTPFTTIPRKREDAQLSAGRSSEDLRRRIISSHKRKPAQQRKRVHKLKRVNQSSSINNQQPAVQPTIQLSSTTPSVSSSTNANTIRPATTNNILPSTIQATVLSSAPDPLPYSSSRPSHHSVTYRESSSESTPFGVKALSSQDSKGATPASIKPSKTPSVKDVKDSKEVTSTIAKPFKILSFNGSMVTTLNSVKSTKPSNITSSHHSTGKNSAKVKPTFTPKTVHLNNTVSTLNNKGRSTTNSSKQINNTSTTTSTSKSHEKKKDRLKDFVKDITKEVFADPRHVINTETELEERLTEILYEVFTKRSHHKGNITNENGSSPITTNSTTSAAATTITTPTATATEEASKRHLLSNSTMTSPANGNRIRKSENEKSSSSRLSQIKSRIDGGGVSTTFSNSKFKSKIETLKMHSLASPRFKKKKSKSRIKIRNTKGHLILGAIKYHDIVKPADTLSNNAIKYATTLGSSDKMPNILRYQSPLETKRSTIPKLLMIPTSGKDKRSGKKTVTFSSVKKRNQKKSSFVRNKKSMQFEYPMIKKHSTVKNINTENFSHGNLNNSKDTRNMKKKKRNELSINRHLQKYDTTSMLTPTNLDIMLNQQIHSPSEKRRKYNSI